jgi:hypothetical protein
MVTPRNLIAAWRGTEVLRHFDHIGQGTLHDAYTAGLRNPHSSDQKCIAAVIAKIGKSVHDEIMAKPVPQEIIEAILRGQRDEFSPDTYPITQEVRAGTVEWKDEFASFEIEHPDAVDAREREKKALIKSFDNLLDSWASFARLQRETLGMWSVEGAIISLNEKGALKQHSNAVIVALAGVAGELGNASFAMSLMPVGTAGSRNDHFDRTKETALTRAANWLVPNSGSSVVGFFRRKPTYTFEEARALLARLLDEYYPPEPPKDDKGKAAMESLKKNMKDRYKFLATMLIVGFVGPLFWLGVKALENFIQSRITLVRQRWRHRHSK